MTELSYMHQEKEVLSFTIMEYNQKVYLYVINITLILCLYPLCPYNPIRKMLKTILLYFSSTGLHVDDNQMRDTHGLASSLEEFSLG